MFEISEELAPRVEALGLKSNAREMAERGWTVFASGASDAFLARLREAIRQHALEEKGQYFDITDHGASCDMLLEKDDVFAEAVLNEPLLAMVEYMCGRAAILSQLTGSLRAQGAKAMAVHCDQDWIPAPFPAHNALMTACWYLDDINEAGAGATKVIGGSHLENRHPSPAETEAQTGAEPILCKRGSIALWDGRLWHSNYARTLPGERILLHATFTRLAYRPIEDYGHLGGDYVGRFGPRMADLLGRNLWFGDRRHNRGGVDMSKYGYTWEAARR
jgi:hypothetical protein